MLNWIRRKNTKNAYIEHVEDFKFCKEIGKGTVTRTVSEFEEWF